ncbi:MAG: Crp/Fnr family transcriptional regulator [Chloroflexota bacterium]
MEDLVRQLGHVRNFTGLSEADLQVIVTAGQVQRFVARSVIFREAEPCAGMFVLLSGQVHLCKLGAQGQEQIMAVIEPVIPFNAVAALDGGPNPATAVAVKDCMVWHIGYEPFQALLRRYPQIGLGLLRMLAARTRFLVSQYEDLSFRSVQARTAKLLLDLSNHGQRTIERREHSIREMSARIGTVPEVVSRSLRAFREEGHIVCTRRAITVCRPEALSRLAQIDAELLKELVSSIGLQFPP